MKNRPKNRIDVKFDELKSANRKALITFITCGDGVFGDSGDVFAYTEAAVLAMIENGADIIELGVPFSDPVAEGAVIQNAAERALKNGVTTDGIFELLTRLRGKVGDTPLLLMLYANSIFGYGAEVFFEKCGVCGVDGVIVPDVPYEEHGEFEPAADACGVYCIRLAAPTSGVRIKDIADGAKGFLYCVSSTGVTGVRSGFSTDFDEFFGQVKQYATIPACVGFGIGDAETAAKMSRYCDGVIVGSAIVKRVAAGLSPDEIGGFVKTLRDVL